ncbi:hypothetical protein QJS04_geneDACA020029 [Acorus gramineus]|uniref:Mei2-like C-terminal RNA recognition motif domain-containing protein n=1 Tax=Acorus gramineus TaxID=55184 RepID=A0AAV9A4X7_ACOGR|nr:hypothetical protein QJS04_geneDACA020029 [Acorus gramineus]
MGDPRTTVMIRNVPNMFTKENMLDLLDKHCLEENMKLAESVALGEADPGARSEFDFFYLPMDFRTGHNLGYAFVNLTNPTATWKLCVAINGRRLDPLGSRKICEITFARIQVVVVLIIIMS